MFSLAELTAPIPAAEFLSRYWTKEAVWLRQPSRTFDAYFDWAALDVLLNTGDLTFPDTLVSREDGPIAASEFTRAGSDTLVDPTAMLRLFRDGASFSIRGADSYWPGLKPIIAGLYDTFFETVHTNIYCSPANTVGFRCHYDLHEVLILQVEGQKTWRVFHPTTPFPVDAWRLEDSPDTTSAPYLDVTLSKGDVLYVPRGHWHYAVAKDSLSLHVTVGISPRKGSAFLDWLTPELLAHPVWRMNAPLMGRPAADGALPDSPEFTAWTTALRQSLLDTLSEPKVLERFAADFYANTRPTLRVHMRTDGTDGPLPVDALVFGRPDGQRHLFLPADSGVRVKVGGAEIELEDADRTLLAPIFGSSSFTLDELAARTPGTARTELADVLDALVRAGLLQATPRNDVG